MKKKAYTLAEVLIAVGIVGVISALLVVALNKTMPDVNKITYLKTYDAICKATKTMAKDHTLYSLSEEVKIMTGESGFRINLSYNKAPFLDVRKPINADYNNTKYEGAAKFGNLLKAALNGKDLNSNPFTDESVNPADVASDPNVGDSVVRFYTQQNNTQWQVHIDPYKHDVSHLSSFHEPAPECSFMAYVTVDINGSAAPNQIYPGEENITEAYNSSKTPDRFRFKITANGKVYPDDLYGYYYLKTRHFLTKKKPDLSKYSEAFNNRKERNANYTYIARDLDTAILEKIVPPGSVSTTTLSNNFDWNNFPTRPAIYEGPTITFHEHSSGGGSSSDTGEEPYVPVVEQPTYDDPNGFWSDCSGADLTVPTVAQMRTWALNNAAFNKATILSSKWHQGTGQWVNMLYEADNAIDDWIDCLLEELVYYYNSANNATYNVKYNRSNNIKSSLTNNYDIYANRVFLWKLNYIAESLKSYYHDVLYFVEKNNMGPGWDCECYVEYGNDTRSSINFGDAYGNSKSLSNSKTAEIISSNQANQSTVSAKMQNYINGTVSPSWGTNANDWYILDNIWGNDEGNSDPDVTNKKAKGINNSGLVLLHIRKGLYINRNKNDYFAFAINKKQIVRRFFALYSQELNNMDQLAAQKNIQSKYYRSNYLSPLSKNWYVLSQWRSWADRSLGDLVDEIATAYEDAYSAESIATAKTQVKAQYTQYFDTMPIIEQIRNGTNYDHQGDYTLTLNNSNETFKLMVRKVKSEAEAGVYAYIPESTGLLVRYYCPSDKSKALIKLEVDKAVVKAKFKTQLNILEPESDD